ncbi:hypothetical protein [Zoogloea ramigera]|uniref:hypothetical protein n=1 Tax=Zoogloea ramigera TaxID=350 RepID=UPI003FA33E0F
MRTLPGRMPPPVDGAAAAMTAPTFTPGPWRGVGHRTIAAGTGPASRRICELYSWGDCTEADGNEALIAAAPELYQVAHDAEAMLTRQKWRPDPSSPEGALLVALRAVLAKVSNGGAS